MSYKRLVFCLAWLLVGCMPPRGLAFGPGDSNRVLVVYNASFTGDGDADGMQDSLQLAQYYANFRSIPASNLLGVASSGSASHHAFYNEMVLPIRAKLDELGPANIDVILLMYGLPFSVQEYNGGVCLDNCLINIQRITSWTNLVWMTNPYLEASPTFGADKGHFDHALYHSGGSNIYMVCRLAAPGGLWGVVNQLEQIRYAEKYISTNQFLGVTYVDSRFKNYTDEELSTNAYIVAGSYIDYDGADANIAYTEHYVSAKNLPLGWEKSGSSIGGGSASIQRATNAFLYGGWYNFQSYRNAFDWLPGSVGCDLNSDSASGMLNGNAWVGGAFQQGLSCASGVIGEPYVNGHPRPNVLLYYLLEGYAFAEASALATPSINWQGVNLGDPLYAPFREKPPAADEAAPVIAAGFPYVSATNLNGAAITFQIAGSSEEPEVARAVLYYGLTPDCPLSNDTRRGYWVRNSIAVTGLQSSAVYYYYVALTDLAGHTTNSPVKTFETLNAPPVASFSANVWTGSIPFAAAFDGTASSDPDGVVEQWNWNFGDGHAGAGATVEHTYTNAGLFVVKLSVVDDKSATNSAFALIEAQPAEGCMALLRGGWNGYAQASDAFLANYSAGDSNRNYGAADTACTYAGSRRAMARFGLESIPPGAIIDSAQLRLFIAARLYGNSGSYWGAFRMLRDWVEGTGNGATTGPGATWTDYDRGSPWNTPGGDFEPNPTAQLSITNLVGGQWSALDVTEAVSNWCSGAWANQGLMLKAIATDLEVNFRTREWNNVAERPLLLVLYHVPESHTIDASSSGSGVVEPSGAVVVERGSNLALTATAEPWHHIAELRTNGAPVAGLFASGAPVANYVYVWSNIVRDGCFEAVFETNGLGINPEILEYACVYQGEPPPEQLFAVTNYGGAEAEYACAVDYGEGASGWFAAAPTNGWVAGGGFQVHTGSVVNGGLDAGVYAATCAVISALAPDRPRNIAIRLTVSRAGQSISFPAIADQEVTNRLLLEATADSGLPARFAVASGPAALEEGVWLSFSGTGLVEVVASQEGNSNWLPAADATNKFRINKATAQVTLGNLNQTYAGAPRVVSVVTVPADLAVLLTYDGGTNPPVHSGHYAVGAVIDDPLYEGGATGMLVVAKADQTISFPQIPHQPISNSCSLSAAADSGLAVQFDVASGPGAIQNGTNLSFTGVGDVVVRASQAGDGDWNPASAVERAVKVYALSADRGPWAGGNELVATNGILGNGTDITKVTICGVAATITGQGANWVRVIPGAGPASGLTGDIVIKSAGRGTTVLPGAYTYNPAGTIAGWSEPSWFEMGSGMNNTVRALATDRMGVVYAAGDFTSAGGVGALRFARWNGLAWSGFGSLNNSAYAAVLSEAGEVYVGGQFTSVGLLTANRMAKWDGQSWTNLGSGLSNWVYGVEATDDGALYAAGTFTQADGLSANRVAKWNGQAWAALGNGLSGAAYCLAADGEGNVYAGGAFTSAGSASAARAAKWDGQSWTNLGGGLNGTVYALALDRDGNLYAGGAFTTADGAPAGRIAKWDGQSWTNLGEGLNSNVLALATDGDGTLYAGGVFTTAGGLPANRIAKWDGQAWTNLGGGLSSNVLALATDGDGTLYAGGAFTGADGASANRVAAWRRTALPGVLPSDGSAAGGYEVAIYGRNLGDGSDITNVTLCGVSVAGIESQSATQVIVVAGGAGPGHAGPGDVRVYSTHFGETTASNGFTYLSSERTLLVQSEYGDASPPPGSYAYPWGTALTNRVSDMDTRGDFQYICAGWVLRDHEPSSGSTNMMSMTLTNDAVLSWLWTTNCRLSVECGPNGTVAPTSGWHALGSSVNLSAQASPYFHFLNWTGDVSGSESNPLSLLMDAPKALAAFFAANVTTNTQTPEWWLADHGITNELEAAATNDPDGDGIPTWQEYAADTDPWDDRSSLRLEALRLAPGSNVLEWLGGTASVQYLEWTPALDAGWRTVATNQPPTSAANQATVEGDSSEGFYRIRAVR
jgi:uncharacterized protein (TIGR03790 family)